MHNHIDVDLHTSGGARASGYAEDDGAFFIVYHCVKYVCGSGGIACSERHFPHRFDYACGVEGLYVDMFYGFFKEIALFHF